MQVEGVITYAKNGEYQSKAGPRQFQSISVEGFFVNLRQELMNGWDVGQRVKLLINYQGQRTDEKTGKKYPDFNVLSIEHSGQPEGQ